MATEIPLTQGRAALVDDVDADAVNKFKWCACRTKRGRFVAVRGTRVNGKRRLVYLHRYLMGLEPGDGLEVDHIDFDGLNNQRSNLRVVSPRANKEYQPSRGGSSRFVGVTFDKARNRWRAQIQVDGQMKNLGRYETEAEAAKARDAFVIGSGTAHNLNFAA